MLLKNNKEKEIKCIKKKNTGFTLVELIVVITILAILGTIAFISFQNYTKNSRDGVRVADINSIKKTLELFITDKGFYPLPDNGTPITYSGATAWVQGTIGDNVIINLGRINKKPIDPLTNNEYTYSVTNTKTEYQLGAVLEGEGMLSYNVPLILKQANAATTKTAIAMVTGSYNEKILKVSTGGIDYVLAVPCIINANLDVKDILNIINNKQLVYNGHTNIPDSYKNSGYTMTGGFDFIPTSGNIVVYSGSTDTLTLDSNKIIFINNLKSVYNGSILQTEPIYNDVITIDTTSNQIGAISLVKSYVDNNVGGLTGNATTIVYGCAVQPSYSGANFFSGLPTLVNQSWQGTGSTIPCYYTCGTGKVLIGEECVTEGCAGTTPDETAKISNAESVNGGTWHYSTTKGVCTYTCNSDYHTIDGGVNCVSNTEPCAIQDGIGKHIWDGSSWGACNVDSCNANYHINGNGCSINTYTVSGSFGINANGATINVCGTNITADSSGNFSTTRNYGSNCSSITATRTGYNCTTTTQGQSQLTADTINIAGSCSIAIEPGNDSHTLVLIHSNTTDGSTVITNSASGSTLGIGNASVTHSTTYPHFGTTSLKFAGGTKYLSLPSISSLGISSSDFTIDFRIYVPYRTAKPVEWVITDFNHYYNRAGSSFHIAYAPNGTIGFAISNISIPSSTVLSMTAWHHIAGVKSGTKGLLFIDGKFEGEAVVGSSINNITYNIRAGLGNYQSSVYTTNYVFEGYMDEIRISNTARWTGSGCTVGQQCFDVRSVPYFSQ